LLHIVDDSTNVSRQAKKRNFTPGEGVRINNITALNQIVSNFSPNMLASKRDRRLKSPCNAHSSNFNSTLRQAAREPAGSQDPGKTSKISRQMNQKSSRQRDNHHSLALNIAPGSTLDYRTNHIDVLSSSMSKNIPIRNYLNMTYQTAQ
jgi:hypothetical protein